MNQFTPNQQLAIETLDRSCIVTAGPGAGKTRVLVERVLNILRRDAAELDQIVAITFTNKAANEMKEKIRRELMTLAESTTKGHEAHHWYDLKRRLDDAAISTIHGFCASVLRAQPVEAQVDPGFAILDEYASRLLLYQAVEEIVNNLIDAGDETAARLVAGHRRLPLVDDLVDLYAAIRTLGLSPDEVENMTIGNISTKDDYQAALAALNDTVDELAGLEKLPPRAQEQIETLQETWTRYRSLLPEEPLIADAPFFDECIDALREARVDRRANAVKELAATLEEQIENLSATFYDVCSRETLRALVKILRQIDRRYREAKARDNGLDYEDLQLNVRDLFRTHPWLARHYAERYRFVLVDEFQDTNGLQKEILDLLVPREARNQKPETRTEKLEASDQRPATNLFIVGDQKQSIYNFRGAAVEVFIQAAHELEEQGAAGFVLEKNFRSTESLIRFFNAFFSRLMILEPEQDLREMQQLGFVEFIPSDANRGASPHPPVELLFEIGEHIKNVEEGREREAARIAARIAEMIQSGECIVAESEEQRRSVRYGDIAILFRAMTDIKVYERALRLRGIPYYVLAGRGFYEREEIQDVLSLLRFLENRTNEIALVSALRSPLFGLSDNSLYWLRQYAEMRSRGVLEHYPLLSSLLEYQGAWGLSPEQLPLIARAAEILAQLLDQRNRVPLAELLEEILATTHFEAIQATFFDGHQRVANLRKLVDLARGFEAGGPHFLSDFIRFVTQFTELETRESEAHIKGGAENVVQIMTVHKAKGLEFPVVIIPDLTRTFRAHAPRLAFDRGLGIGMEEPDRRGRLHATRLRQQVKEQINWREYFENQRLLFVAATRAKDYLILAGAATKLKRKDKTAKDEEQPTPSLRKVTSWFEWICTLLNIHDPQSLPEIYEWNDIPLRVTPSGEGVAEAREAETRLIDRFPEAWQGKPLLAETIPEWTDDDRQAFESIVKLVGPIQVEPSASSQPLAATRLLTYARCPLQYYYETVLGLPARDEYEKDPRPETQDPRPERISAAERGRIVHRFCELYDGSEAWESLLQRLVGEAAVSVEEGALHEVCERTLADVKPLVEHYLNSELWQQIEQILWGGKPGRVQSEVEFIYHTGVLPLRGRLDKLIVSGDSGARIIDFKTNRVPAKHVDEIAREYEWQMRIYALAARRALRLENVQAELYFLDPDVRFEVDQQRLNETQTAHEINELCKEILKIRGIDDARARPSPDRCPRCPCFSFCPSREG